MKLYYDNAGTWVEVINIISFPIPQIRMDETSQIIIEIRDFEGALYDTWKDRDFINMMVTDGAETPTTLYRGFITGKKYKHNKLTIGISGFSKKLEGIPLNHNYVLEQGKVLEVPATKAGNESNIYAEAPDIQTNWLVSDSSHWNAVLDYSGYIMLSPDSTNVVDEFTVGTIAAAAVSKIRVYLYGYRGGIPSTPNAPEVDIDMDGWQGYISVPIPGYYGSGSSDWAYAEFEGDWNQANLDALKVRLKGTTGGQQVIKIEKMYIKVFYTGLVYDSLGLEDLSDPPQPFDWDADYWNSGFQDRGILITDSTKGTETKTWDASACAITGENTKDEAFAKANTKNDDIYVWANETEQPYNAIINFDIDGTGVPTTHYLQRIEIDYQFGHWINANGVSNTRVKTELQIKKDADWISVKTLWSRIWYPDPDIRRWIDNPTIIIEDTHAELLKYFDTDNGNYDSLKGLRFVTTPEFDWEMGIVITEVDYISVRVYHNTLDIAPIMEKINDSEDHWIKTTGIDWTDTGVYVGDKFKIGESTTQILTDIDIISGVTIKIQSTLSKYIAQWFKGTYCIEVLKKICLLEGLHWWEDHQKHQIIVSKEVDFVDSTVDLTQANYLWEWEFEGNSNQYKSVEVFGSSALRIYYKATDPDPTNVSYLIKTIIEESILTVPEAKEIADEQLLEYKVKRPSIKIPLNGVRALLGVGKTVTLTMNRPTVVEADYPIRMIERHKIGITGIKTIIWCGLGKTTQEEKWADTINKAMYLAHRAHTDRIISTPPGEGAIITWGSIGGADAGVRNIITTELVNGQSIDNTIDTLIATHHLGTSTDHDDRYYTETEINTAAYVNSAEAVAAVVAADNYIKNDANDIMGGNLTVNNLITAGNVDGVDVSGLPASIAAKCTTAEAHAYVEANALTLTANVTFNAGQLFDGKDVSGLCTTAEALTHVQNTGLTMSANIIMGTNDITLGAGQLVDGVDISAFKASFDALDYYTQAQVNNAIDVDIATHHDPASTDHDDRYYTEAEVDAHNWLEADISDLDKYTQAQVDDRVFEQSAAFPGAPSEGDFHYDEDDDSLYRYNAEAEAWIEIGAGGPSASINFPIGAIIMFKGAFTNNVTIAGWYKCDGNNGTVNLIDKFVRGGATSGAEGGSDDAVVVEHNHTVRVSTGTPGVTAILTDTNQSYVENETLIGNTGESGVGANIPAFYTLIYIERIS